MASLETQLRNLATAAATRSKANRTLINGNAADLSALTTVAKNNLVAAINEVAASVGSAGATINDTTTSTLSVWSSSKTNTEIAAAISALVGSSETTLNTLQELGDALGDDPNFATTMTNLIGAKAPSNNPVFTGTVTIPDGALSIADTAGLQAALDAKITGFADPNADRIVFWDDSAGAYAALSLTGLTITGTALTVDQGTSGARGALQLASLAEMTTGTDTAKAVTPAGVRQEINTRSATGHTHTMSNITDASTAIPAAVPQGTTAVLGKLQLATLAEATTGTDTAKAMTAQAVRQEINTRAASAHTHTASQVTDFNTAADARVNALVPAADLTTAGKVELATVAETATGSDATRAVTPAGLKGVTGELDTDFAAVFTAALV